MTTHTTRINVHGIRTSASRWEISWRASTLTRIRIEAAGVNLLGYVAPGDQHTVFSDGPFYEEEVNGETLVDWVTKLVKGEAVDDVHCTASGRGVIWPLLKPKTMSLRGGGRQH